MSKRPNEGKGQQRSFKKSRLYNARAIRSEVSDPAFKDGVLDVTSFVRSRKYEIESLERAQFGAKYASSTRVFQALPRKLRRRGASHNVKRIPKRLRNKAIREMLSSNKAAETAAELKKKKPRVSGKTLYRLKLSRNLLKVTSKMRLLRILPSSQLLNKNLNIRAAIRILTKQIKDVEALRKSQDGDEDGGAKKITLNNKYGSYDNTGINALAQPSISKVKYLKRQKAFRWLSTHVWHAKRFHLLKRWGWNIPYKPTQKCFRLAHRTYRNTGTIVFDTSYEGTIVVESRSSLGWQAIKSIIEKLIQKKLSKSYVNGSKFYSGELYGESSKDHYEVISNGVVYCNSFNNTNSMLIQMHPANFEQVWNQIISQIPDNVKDSVQVQDCRFSMGSIDLVGPKSLESLVSILHPVELQENIQWGKLRNVANIGSLTSKNAISLLINDPRLYKRPVKRRSVISEEQVLDLVLALNDGKLNNKAHVEKLFSPQGRNDSYKNQMTIKQINQKRRQLENPTQVKITTEENSIQIPIVILADSTTKKYKLFAPWYWISPIWQCLVRIPKIVPGGLLQMNQIHFESCQPFFPNDYPYTVDGMIENQLIASESRAHWSKRPKNKRLNYAAVEISSQDNREYGFKGEIGDWFNCDWRFLQLIVILLKVYEKNKGMESQLDISKELLAKITIWDSETFLRKIYKKRDVYECIKDVKKVDGEKEARGEKLVNPVKLCNYGDWDIEKFNSTLEDAFTKNNVAQLLDNRLPVTGVVVRLLNGGKIKSNARIYKVPTNMNSLIQTNTHDKLNKIITECPSFEYLIGFISTGSFNLTEGNYTGIGYVVSETVREKPHYCIVRSSGSKTVRVGEYRLLK